jgi:hypothetical protein
MNTLGVAFKEWAVICEALAEGRQVLILRKGGIAEPGGAFRVEHDRFWLLPTYLHQHEAAVVESYHDLLSRSREQQPPAGTLRLSHFAEVVRVHRCTTLEQALSLEGQHGWSRATVEARFNYRAPGLFALVVRVYRATPFELAETPYSLGCKTWAVLGRDFPTTPAVAALADDNFKARSRPLDRLFSDPCSPRG